MLTIMVGCVIVPGLPTAARALGIEGNAGWLVTLPSLGVVLFGPLAGWMIDRAGAYFALCTGLVLYAVLGMGTVFLHGPVPVFSARILLGGVTALVMAGGTTLISERYHGSQRIAMIARQGMAIELGGVIFLAIGGILTTLGWRAPFALYGVSLLFLVMVLASVKSRLPHQKHKEKEESSGQTQGMWSVRIGAVCSMAVFFSAIIVLPFRLSGTGDNPLAFSEAEVGYFLSFVSLIAVGAAAAMPWFLKRRGDVKTLMIAFASYEGAHLCFAFAEGLPLLVIGAIALGCGFGLSVPLVNHMTIERSSAGSRGRNLAYLSMAIFFGQFLASPLEYVPGGTQATFIASAVVSFVAVLVGVHSLRRKSLGSTSQTTVR